MTPLDLAINVALIVITATTLIVVIEFIVKTHRMIKEVIGNLTAG